MKKNFGVMIMLFLINNDVKKNKLVISLFLCVSFVFYDLILSLIKMFK